MTRKDQAIAKTKYYAMETLYLQAWKKNPANVKLKEMWKKLTELHGYFDQACAAVNYNQQAAIERDDKFFALYLENKDLKEQIEQLKEARDKAVKNWEEQA